MVQLQNALLYSKLLRRMVSFHSHVRFERCLVDVEKLMRANRVDSVPTPARRSDEHPVDRVQVYHRQPASA